MRDKFTVAGYFRQVQLWISMQGSLDRVQKIACHHRQLSPVFCCLAIFLIPIYLPWLTAAEAGSDISTLYPKDVQDVLTTYCYDCHGDGMSKGKVAFDQFQTHTEMLAHRDLWMMALKNLRAGVMPPEKKARPNSNEQLRLENWIKTEMFGIDPDHPDPGRVTLRRLNRTEYRNTIRDLTGYDFNVEEELPPDDTGYGFDTIGDVLNLSPLLLEKYMSAAEKITAEVVPRVAASPAEKVMQGSGFVQVSGKGNAENLSYYQPANVSHPYQASQDGSYHFELEVEVRGNFEFDPGKCRVLFQADQHELWTQEFGWQNRKKFNFQFEQKLSAGDHSLALQLLPLTPAEQRKNSLELRLLKVVVRGPLEQRYWVRPKNFERFFWKDPPPKNPDRRLYAREVLRRFATRAYRRPVDERTLNRLVSIAEKFYLRPGKRFEDGIAEAIIPVLASPRFLFRVENVETSAGSEKYPLLDEYSLASRLSYFLWSTMPDDELFTLAEHHQLRSNLSAQIQRMINDPRSQALVENFVGQWLQVRDVEGINIDERMVLARDRDQDREVERRIKRFRELDAIPEAQRTPEQVTEINDLIEQRKKRLKERQIELDHDLRKALREETQMTFNYVLQQDRDVRELLDSDYTFLNEKLASHYGITNITGTAMRRVTLPEGSHRGGVLTDGSILIVTSNPTRTSPVKRGVFILDNILGMPAPPPPANVPALEESEKEFAGRQPTLRETLEVHRNKPLCSACHSRMDPLGLALENFNALGMWREHERGAPIDPAGKLITGESFDGISDLKHSLATRHGIDFYRCLTEKLLTYALGRGMEYYDVESVDEIVEKLEKSDGHFSALLTGVIQSAPFQRTRPLSHSVANNAGTQKPAGG